MKNFLITLLMVPLFFSCKEQREQKQSELVELKKETIHEVDYPKLPPVKDFAGKIYTFIVHDNSSPCDVLNGYDCNGFDVLFLDKENYIFIYYCLYTRPVIKGKYKIKNDKIFFISDSLHVIMEKDDPDIMVESRTCMEKRYSKPTIDTVFQFQCKDKMFCKWINNDTYFGYELGAKSLEKKIEDLKSDSTWFLLEMDNNILIK